MAKIPRADRAPSAVVMNQGARAAQLQREHNAMLAHDIKAALSIIRMQAKILRETTIRLDGAAATNEVDKITLCTDYAARLVESILLDAEIESTDRELELNRDA